jgi:hypothetical protein
MKTNLTFLILLSIVLASCNLPGNTPGAATSPVILSTPTAGQVATATPTELPIQVTDTPAPTASPTGTITLTPAADCDLAQFMTDVTYPDNTEVKANEKITKTWQLRNMGSCAWDSTYRLVFIRGEQMSGTSPAEVITKPVEPGAFGELSIPLTAPAINGTHWGVWQLQNGAGKPVLKTDGTPQELSILIVIKDGQGGKVTSVRTWEYTYTGTKCTSLVEYEISANIHADGPVVVKYIWNVTSGNLTVISQNYTFAEPGFVRVTTQIKAPFTDPNNVQVTLTANGISGSFTICP